MHAQPIRLLPSLLAADFANLEAAVRAAEGAGAEALHVDVMDGHFVPNISFGPPVIAAIRRVTRLKLDVHLMIAAPERYIEAFAAVGADSLTVHAEATPHLHQVVEQIHAHGVRAGVALNPATPLGMLEEILPDVDLVLLMTVNPGFGGQAFIPSTLPKIARLRQMLDARGLAIPLEVDGGINEETAPLVVAAGATWLVAGSAVFGGGTDGVTARLARLRDLAGAIRA